jgi:hypothetical protein
MRVVKEREATDEEIQALPQTSLALEPTSPIGPSHPERPEILASPKPASNRLSEASAQALFGTVRAIAMILNARLLLLLALLGDFSLCWAMPDKWLTLSIYQVAVVLLVGLNWAKG